MQNRETHPDMRQPRYHLLRHHLSPMATHCKHTAHLSDYHTMLLTCASKSPSVYIGFTSLYAYDFCGTVGEVFTSTTIEFDPTEISTLGRPVPTTSTDTQVVNDFSTTDPNAQSTFTTTFTESVGRPSAINFRDLGQDCSSIEGYTFLASEPLTEVNSKYPFEHDELILTHILQLMIHAIQ
jgi:hypothetical protein